MAQGLQLLLAQLLVSDLFFVGGEATNTMRATTGFRVQHGHKGLRFRVVL